MRIVFAGTPAIAVPSLEALVAHHDVVLVVTLPDRPSGRGRKLQKTPVAAAAGRLGLECIQPESINEPPSVGQIESLAPDVLCLIAYGGFLKSRALAAAKIAPLNAHPSLLPRHRGASPIPAAILAGDTETGVTILRMVRQLDAGPMLLQKRLPLAPQDTTATLGGKLAELAAEAFLEALALLQAGEAVWQEQDESQATFAPKLEKHQGTINWERSAGEIDRQVRAMTPWPGASGEMVLRGRRLALKVAQVQPVAGFGQPGEVLEDEHRIVVACREGALRLARVQLPGRKEMDDAAFLNGLRDQPDDQATEGKRS